jgi:hypothetical protein
VKMYHTGGAPPQPAPCWAPPSTAPPASSSSTAAAASSASPCSIMDVALTLVPIRSDTVVTASSSGSTSSSSSGGGSTAPLLRRHLMFRGRRPRRLPLGWPVRRCRRRLQLCAVAVPSGVVVAVVCAAVAAAVSTARAINRCGGARGVAPTAALPVAAAFAAPPSTRGRTRVGLVARTEIARQISCWPCELTSLRLCPVRKRSLPRGESPSSLPLAWYCVSLTPVAKLLLPSGRRLEARSSLPQVGGEGGGKVQSPSSMLETLRTRQQARAAGETQPVTRDWSRCVQRGFAKNLSTLHRSTTPPLHRCTDPSQRSTGNAHVATLGAIRRRTTDTGTARFNMSFTQPVDAPAAALPAAPAQAPAAPLIGAPAIAPRKGHVARAGPRAIARALNKDLALLVYLGELTVEKIFVKTSISKSSVSHHLRNCEEMNQRPIEVLAAAGCAAGDAHMWVHLKLPYGSTKMNTMDAQAMST